MRTLGGVANSINFEFWNFWNSRRNFEILALLKDSPMYLAYILQNSE